MIVAYRGIPRRCSDETAEGNVSRLRSLVEIALDGAALAAVKVSALPALWHDFVAKKQDRKAPDYSRRAAVNGAINSHMRQAASIFRRKLWPHYARQGISLPPDCGAVEYLPIMQTVKPAADDAALVAAWERLATTDGDMWLAVGLARFAGLRAGEILACRGKWIERRGGGAVVCLRDREEDRHFTKTGRMYSAPILHAGLAEYLLALDGEAAVIAKPGAARWLTFEPQKWLRPFVGAAKMPLHRLRGLYADQLKRETEAAILARAGGLRAAQEALGHTTPQTTERHYTTPDL